MSHTPNDQETNQAFLTNALAFGNAEDEMKHLQFLALSQQTFVNLVETSFLGCIGYFLVNNSPAILKSNNTKITIL